jgi:hypothetical protein
MINVDELTLAQVKALLGMCGAKGTKPFPYRPGDCVLIRTVTMIQTGRIVAIGRDWIELEQAAWIASTKRFSVTLSTGECEEVEPIPGNGRAVVGRGAIVDMFDWVHPLPRTVR